MMKKIIFVVAASLIFLMTLQSNKSMAQQPEEISLTFPNLHLEKGERVISFSLYINGGYFSSMPRIPPGWSMTINNGANLSSTIEAGAELGSSAFQEPEFHGFRFAVSKMAMDGIKFDVKLKATVTSDFIKTRDVNAGMKDVVIQ